MSRLRPQHDDTNVVLDKKAAPKLKPPQMYRVLLHNDDYTAMDFVVRVLEEVFAHSEKAAAARMLQVHTEGRALVGAYELAVALAKAEQVRELATEAEFPLLCTVEKAS